MQRGLVGAGVAAVILAGLAWFLNAQGLLHFGHIKPLQVTGDPPITVSDGSLHAKSKNGWTSDAQTDQLMAMPADGQLVAGANCGLTDGNGKYVAASLWTDDDDDQPYTISPGQKVVIHHDSGEASSAANDKVTIRLPTGKGPLTIVSDEGYFAAEDINPMTSKPFPNGKHNRRHVRPGNISSIEIKDSTDTVLYKWPPKDYTSKNPHFTLSFCYQ
jgi:hypothetical protein